MHGRHIRDLLDNATMAPDAREAFDRVLDELDEARHVNAMQRQVIGRLDDELRAASNLQQSLRHTPATVRGAFVRTIYEPADTLSGDICDVTRVGESQVCITLADVTGHGLTSAILAAHVRRSLRGDRHVADANGRLCPSQILRRANRELLESPPQDCQFVTTVVAVFDEDTQVLRWARGGAPYPILLRPGPTHVDPTCRVELLQSDGPLLGVLPEARFDTADIQLQPGDMVVFHTDGLDACLEEVPAEFCSRTLESGSDVGDPLDGLIARIETRIAAHDLGDPTHDDVSVVAMRLPNQELTPQRPRDSQPVEAVKSACRATVPIDSRRTTVPV